MNAPKKFDNMRINQKAKIVVQNIQHSVLVKCYYLIYTEMRYNLCFNGYTWTKGSTKTL